jgi:hypothetical protein
MRLRFNHLAWRPPGFRQTHLADEEEGGIYEADSTRRMEFGEGAAGGLCRKGKNITNARKENLRCLLRIFRSPVIGGGAMSGNFCL